VLDHVSLHRMDDTRIPMHDEHYGSENINKEDGYRQLNVRQLGSLRPWDYRGKCYMDRKRIQCLLVKCLAACTHLSSTVSEI